MQVNGFHHVQVAIPEGGEDAARAFYGGVLGLVEIDKPEALAARGGCWFAGIGIGAPPGRRAARSAPATKAHVAIGVADLDRCAGRARAPPGGAMIDDGLDVGFRRFYTQDPFGNRLELVERRSSRDSSPPAAVRDEFEISTEPTGSIWPGSSRRSRSGPTGRWAGRPRRSSDRSMARSASASTRGVGRSASRGSSPTRRPSPGCATSSSTRRTGATASVPGWSR